MRDNEKNENTDIGENAFQKCENLTIKGYEGTAAEALIKESDIQFVSVGTVPVATTTTAVTTTAATTTTTVSEPKILRGDVTGDGEASVDDAQWLLKYYTEKTVAGKDITWMTSSRRF